MKAVILAAGKCTDMFVLTDSRPKPMIPIAGKPMLVHLLNALRDAGVKDITLVTGYRESMFRDYFSDGSGFGVNLTYYLRPDGEEYGSTLLRMADMYKEPFLLLESNGLLGVEEISRMISPYHFACGINTRDSGSPQYFGAASVLKEPDQTPESTLSYTGIYYFHPEIFDAIRNSTPIGVDECDFTKPLNALLEQNVVQSYCLMDCWQRLRYPWDFLEANEGFMKRIEERNDGVVEPGAQIIGAVTIGKNSRIRSGSYIVGPVVIGDGCDIGPNCYLRANTTIGDGCRIGAATEVKNSIIMRGTKIPHHNYVGDSVIGENCNLGSGTKIANLRLDKKNVMIKGIDTGRRKMGAILGDGVQTGINASIDAGSLLGDGVFVGPGATVHGEIPPGSRIR
jgi:bifunctional UDP-N-acetylglucosamine pyrophosphorylase/glucosamine-1-phosphate N-acetyltransferase